MVTTDKFQTTVRHAATYNVNELPPPYVGNLTKIVHAPVQQPRIPAPVSCTTSTTCVSTTQLGSRQYTNRFTNGHTDQLHSASTAHFVISDETARKKPTASYSSIRRTAEHTYWLRVLLTKANVICAPDSMSHQNATDITTSLRSTNAETNSIIFITYTLAYFFGHTHPRFLFQRL